MVRKIKLLTTSKAAQRGRVSGAAIINWANTGQLDCIRPEGGGPRLFAPEDVDRTVAEKMKKRKPFRDLDR